MHQGTSRSSMPMHPTRKEVLALHMVEVLALHMVLTALVLPAAFGAVEEDVDLVAET